MASAICPPGWMDAGSYCYGVVRAGTWQQTMSYCGEYGVQSSLTQLANEVETMLVSNGCVYTTSESEYWIGDVGGAGCEYMSSGRVITGDCDAVRIGCCRIPEAAYSVSPSPTRSITPSRSRSPSMTRTRSTSVSQSKSPSASASQSMSSSVSATASTSSTVSPSQTTSPSTTLSSSTSPLPSIWGDSRTGHGNWTYGYYAAGLEYEFPLEEDGDHYMSNSFAKVSRTTIATNTGSMCPFSQSGFQVPFARWTNTEGLVSPTVNIIFEITHTRACGDGIDAALLINRHTVISGTSANKNALVFNEYLQRSLVYTVELMVSGRTSCICDVAEYYIAIIPSYNGASSSRPSVSITPSPDKWNLDEDSYIGRGGGESSQSVSASPSASASASPSASLSPSLSTLPYEPLPLQSPSQSPSQSPLQSPLQSPSPHLASQHQVAAPHELNIAPAWFVFVTASILLSVIAAVIDTNTRRTFFKNRKFIRDHILVSWFTTYDPKYERPMKATTLTVIIVTLYYILCNIPRPAPVILGLIGSAIYTVIFPLIELIFRKIGRIGYIPAAGWWAWCAYATYQMSARAAEGLGFTFLFSFLIVEPARIYLLTRASKTEEVPVPDEHKTDQLAIATSATDTFLDIGYIVKKTIVAA